MFKKGTIQALILTLQFVTLIFCLLVVVFKTAIARDSVMNFSVSQLQLSVQPVEDDERRSKTVAELICNVHATSGSLWLERKFLRDLIKVTKCIVPI